MTCKRNESVCGIAGRENTFDFECVDTRVALDSCEYLSILDPQGQNSDLAGAGGGCITPHPFHEPYRSTVTGVECGRLPGVLSSGCANSRCVVSRCKDGQEPSADKTRCVATPSLVQQYMRSSGASGSLRLNARQRRDVAPTTVIPNSELRGQIEAVVNLVVDLSEAAHSVPAPQDTSIIDYITLAQATVDATVKLVDSNTIADVVANINALVDLNTDFKKQLTGCECVENLGLGVLVVKLDALLNTVLNLQRWCKENPVGVPVGPEVPEPGTLPTPIPNTSDLAIDLDLDALLEILARLTTHASLLADVGSAAHIDATIVGKISALAQLVVDLSNGTTSLPSPPNDSAPIPIPIVGTTELPVDANLARAVVQATVNLLGSTTVPAVLANIDILVNVNAIVTDALTNCGCIEDKGLGSFIAILDTVGQAALDLKNNINLDADVLGTIDLGLDALLANLTAKLNVVGDASTNVELQSKIDALVQLVVALQGKTLAAPGLLPSVPSMPTPGLPNKSILGGIVRVTTDVLGSLTVPELLAKVDALVHVSVSLGKMLSGCHCVEALGLAEIEKGVNAVAQAAIALQGWGASNTIPGPPSPGTVIVNADLLVQALAAVAST